MAAWTGQMPTSRLNDLEIRPIQFHKWAHAHRDFARRTKDRAVVEELKRSIPERGLLKPILLGVSDLYPDVYVGDGHHRAVALMDLGIETFPYHWYWIKAWGRPQMERSPFPDGLLK